MDDPNQSDDQPTLLLVPGIQGRWEYMRRTVDALGAFFRVVTFSVRSGDIDGAAAEAGRALDAAGVDRAVICGVSFGGIVALRFAGSQPERTAALVLASTPGPDWHLVPRHERYARHPWLFAPLFAAETPLRLREEVRSALPSWRERRRFALAQLATLVAAPVSFTQIAERARAIERSDRRADCARVGAPTLVVTGEAGLDHVVPVDGSSAYADRIRGATRATMPRTGHLGSMTRPDEFASLVDRFVRRLAPAADRTDAREEGVSTCR